MLENVKVRVPHAENVKFRGPPPPVLFWRKRGEGEGGHTLELSPEFETTAWTVRKLVSYWLVVRIHRVLRCVTMVYGAVGHGLRKRRICLTLQ